MRTAKGKAADLIKYFDEQIDDAIDEVIRARARYKEIRARATYKEMCGGSSQSINVTRAVDKLKVLVDGSRDARAIYGWFPIQMKEDEEE